MMPNFKKRSEFDEGDVPPIDDYVDWTPATTRIITVKLGEDQYADVELKKLHRQYVIVEELITGLKADQCGKLIVRVRR